MRTPKYFFILIFLFSSLVPFYSFAFLPLVAAPLIETILGRIIASRVAAYVATGAAGATAGYTANKLTNNTITGLTNSILRRAGDISADSIYRVATGSLNWQAANYLYQNIPFQHYLDKSVGAITDGFEKSGKFFSTVGGQLMELAFLPSPSSPYLYAAKSDITKIPASAGLSAAISQCKSAYIAYIDSSDFFCSSSPESSATASYYDYYGHSYPSCTSADIIQVDVAARKIWLMCHRAFSTDYSVSRPFSFAPTGYQPPPPDPDSPLVLPNTPSDIIKPSLGNSVPSADVASLLNSMAQDAASLSDYDGVPFSPSAPITEQEVKAAIAGDGTAAQPALASPTVADFVAPAQSAGASSAIAVDVPTSASVPSDTSTPSDGTKEDKPDYSFPATPQPYLETPPDGATILKPLTSLLPFLKNFQFHSKQVECPVYSFDFIGTTVTIDEHCIFFAKYGALIKSVCTAFWLFSALRIVLSA